MRLFSCLLALFICLLDLVAPFANILLKECKKEIRIGISMMASPIRWSGDKVIEVVDLGEQTSVVNGSALAGMKSFLVKVHPPTAQCALEVKGGGAYFPRGGKCNGKRVLCGNRNGALLELPEADMTEVVEIVAAWGVSFNDGVQLSAPFTILPPPAEAAGGEGL